MGSRRRRATDASAARGYLLVCYRPLAAFLVLDAGSFLGAVFRDTLIGCSVPLETTAAHDTLRETVLHR